MDHISSIPYHSRRLQLIIWNISLVVDPTCNFLMDMHCIETTLWSCELWNFQFQNWASATHNFVATVDLKHNIVSPIEYRSSTDAILSLPVHKIMKFTPEIHSTESHDRFKDILVVRRSNWLTIIVRMLFLNFWFHAMHRSKGLSIS